MVYGQPRLSSGLSAKTLRLLVAVLVTSLCLGLSACRRGGDGEFLESGRARLQSRDFRGAMIQFRNAVDRNPGNAEARFRLGAALRRLGDHAMGEIELRKALELGYDSDAVMLELLPLLIASGRPDLALEEVGRYQPRAEAARASLQAWRGEALLAKGRDVDARQAYVAALQADPANVVAQAGQARLALLGGDVAAADAILLRLAAVDPVDSDAWFLQGRRLMDQGKKSDAVAALRKAVEIRPGDLNAQMALVWTLIELKDLTGASEVVARLKRFYPSASLSAYAEALLAYHKGDKALARAAVQQALKVVPDQHDPLVLGGLVEMELGNFGQAERYLSQAVGGWPQDARARRLLAMAYRGLSQPAKALKALEPLIGADSRDTEALVLAAEVHQASGQTGRARTLLRQALAASPEDADLRGRYWGLLARSGQLGEAEAELEAASRSGSDAVTAELHLASLYTRQRRFDKLATLGERVIREQPARPEGYHILGLGLLGRGDEAAARARFEHALARKGDYFPSHRSLVVVDVQAANYEAARTRAQAFVEAHPRHEAAALLLLDVLKRSSTTAEDIGAALDRVVTLNPTSVRLQTIRVETLLGYGAVKRALDAARSAAAQLPNEQSVQFSLARAQHAAGELSQALTTYGKLASTVGNSPLPLLGQAEVLVSESNWKEARAAILKAQALAPENPAVHQALVALGLQAGQHEEARAAAREFQNKWPKLAFGYEAEARALVAAKRHDEAVAVLKGALAQGNDFRLATVLFGLLSERQLAADVEDLLRQWSARNPGDERLLLHAGDTAVARDKLELAESYYRRALALAPGSVGALNNVAWVLGRRRSPDAVRAARAALAKAPSNPAVQDTAGAIFLDAGDVDGALKLLQGAARALPAAPGVRLNYARALLAAGRKSEADSQIATARKLPGSDALRAELDALSKPR